MEFLPGRAAVIQYLTDLDAPLDVYTPINNGTKESEGRLASIISLLSVETALQKAVREKLSDVVELLVKNGADVTIKGRYTNTSVSKRGTAFELAEMLGFDDIGKLLAVS